MVLNSGSFCGTCGQCVLSVEYFLSDNGDNDDGDGDDDDDVGLV